MFTDTKLKLSLFSVSLVFCFVSFANATYEKDTIAEYKKPYIVEVNLNPSSPDELKVDFIIRTSWPDGCRFGESIKWRQNSPNLIITPCRIPKKTLTDDPEFITLDLSQSSTKRHLQPQTIRIIISVDEPLSDEYSVAIEFISGAQDKIIKGKSFWSRNPKISLVANKKEDPNVNDEENVKESTIKKKEYKTSTKAYQVD